MEKGKHVAKKDKFIKIYTVILIIATLFISIGYANIVEQEMSINGTTFANAQDRSIYNRCRIFI